MNSHFKQSQHNCIHPIFSKVGMMVVRKEYRKIQYRLYELGLTAQACGPLLKSSRPVFLVFFSMIFAIPQKTQLVFSELVTIDSSEILIKCIEGLEVFRTIPDYLFTERIIQPKGIVHLFIRCFRLINQCDQETFLQSKLDSFE